MDSLIFSEFPIVKFATNIFVNVRTILQYDKTPLIEVVDELITKKIVPKKYTTQIRIYHSDGTYLAKAVGTRLVKSPESDKAGVKLFYPKGMTVCTLNGKTLFEIKRNGPSQLSTTAELFTPDGYFIKSPQEYAPQLFLGSKQEPLDLTGIIIENCTFHGSRIGIWIKSDQSISMGVNQENTGFYCLVNIRAD